MPLKFCRNENFANFAAESPKWGGGFPPPLGGQSSISNLILTFQILTEIVSLIELWVFILPTLFEVFGFPYVLRCKDTLFFLHDASFLAVFLWKNTNFARNKHNKKP
jgi:hypothetical protein